MGKKICHVTSAHQPFDGRIFERECTSLAKQYEVYMIVPNTDDCERNNVHVLGVHIPPGRVKRLLHLKYIYRRMKEVDADVYHIHEPELIPYALKMKKKGKVIIFDSHEDMPAMILNMNYLPKIVRKVVSPLYEKYENHSIRKFDGVISVDPRIVEKLKQHNSNTVMVTNYPQFKEIETIDRGDKAICFTGGIGYLWLVDNIIRSVENIDVKVVLAGATTDDYIQRLKNLSGWDKVDYRGHIPHKEALKIQQESFAGMALLDYGIIVGGKWGTLGNTKLFEYMMAGTPIIATDFILWKEIINKYECGICVNPHDTNAIADAIKYLQGHPEEVKRMGENGKRASREEFNWSTQEKTLFDFYKKTVGA